MDDPRFARIKKDPRFKSLPKKQLKTKLNKKFSSILKDPKFSTKPKFDIYGNKRKYNSEFKDHYELEDEEEEQVIQQEEDEGNQNEDQSLEQDQQEDSKEKSQDESDQNEEELNSEEDISISSGVDNWEDEDLDQKNAPIILQATKRLALQNYDWQQIKAKDLFVLFSSFAPTGSSIQQVQVYVSEYGKQKLAEENEFGPRQIFKENYVPKKQKDEVSAVNELIVKGHEEDLDVDPIKLRQYEKDRLKYYYAVIECDSNKTADQIYQQINGKEFELTNIKIDLRFIPDDVVLPKDNLKQECNTLPSHITSNNIINRAVGHTDVKLTWEDSKPRTNFWNKNIKNFNKEDFEDIVGNYESEDEEKIKEDVKDLLNQVQENKNDEEEDWRNSFKKKSKSNLKITFQSGFNPDGQNSIIERMGQKSKKIHVPKEGRIDDFFVGFQEQEQDDDDNEGRPKEHLKYLERKKLKKQELKQKRFEQAQLKLLVEDDKKPKIGFNPNDKRFEAIHTKPEYAIDPTNKQFKSVQNEQEQRKKQKLF
ncbi:unnamed protein product [Paramecium primaurelia]|uniref:NUC153 domain-containing protein n=1 Tax=Paramecium primaurelia TaxID=5886 RepID=A0A8S1LXG9_PARPR|nr:unnamed protein product [Paramecium primaurelia]